MKKATDIDIHDIDTDSPEFQNALTLLRHTSQSVFLTGKAGTGKSTFLRYLTQTTKKKYVVLAPTGIAAVNSGGQTLHSFFRLPFKPMLPNDSEVASISRLRDRLKYSKAHIELIKSLDLIIIDEVSMVRADIIDFIDRILRVYCGNFRQPFGGKQLLFVGDVFQLEPVVTSDTRDVLTHYYKNGTFFFNADVFRQFSVVPIELKKVYRQKDDAFIGLLDRVRAGTPSQADINLLNSRVVPNAALFDDDFVMTIATRREIVDFINQSHLDQLKTPLHTFTGKVEGDFPENSLPTDKELQLKEDAQVVFVRNDPERRWVNGTIGRVVEFQDDAIVVMLENGTKHAVETEVWENVKYEYDEEHKRVNEIVIGTYCQFPLKLAWALTIHKSQGLTFDKVIVDVGQGAFSGGQTYVALSRCRSLEGLKLKSTINFRDIFVNQKVVNFSRSFNDQRLIDRALQMAEADRLFYESAKAFDRDEFDAAVDMFSEASRSRNVIAYENVARLVRAKTHRFTRLLDEVAECRAQIEEYKKKFMILATEYVEMGEACREEGWELQSAIANYDKAIDLCPDYAFAWLCRGMALAQMGDFDASIDSLDHAATLDTEDYRALYEAGRMYANNGDLTLGMDYLLRAEQRNGKVAAIHLALADVYDMIDDPEQAQYHRDLAAKLKRKK